MAVHSLPLLQLPSTVVMKVLKSMDTMDQIAISLVSRATKSRIISMNLKDLCSQIEIDHTLRLSIRIRNCVLDWHFRYEDWDTIQSVKLVKNDSKSNWRPTTYEWRKEGFRIKNWFEHLAKMTNIDSIFVSVGGERLNIYLNEMIQGLNTRKLELQPWVSNAFAQSILNTVKARMLIIYRNPYQDKELFQKNLMENFEAIHFSSRPHLTLNDVLAISSPVIDIDIPENITMKTLNRFIKCWKTGSNRQLRYLTIGFQNSDVSPHVDDILRGIKHTKYPENQTREFELPEASYTNKRFVLNVNGGYDICAFDGRKATISIEMHFQVVMLVWPF